MNYSAYRDRLSITPSYASRMLSGTALGVLDECPGAAVMSASRKRDLPRGGRLILGVLIFGVVATVAYWVVWFGVDREILGSAHTESYYAFENSFPVADAWMTLVGLAAAVALLRRHASALLWSIAAGTTSIYLGLSRRAVRSRKRHLPFERHGRRGRGNHDQRAHVEHGRGRARVGVEKPARAFGVGRLVR